jgi:serine/threonine-protein kinase
MSPEQVRGSRLVDHRSDLWSLAVIAYRALTGQLPFQGVDVADLILKICGERAAPPSHAEPALGPDVDAFFARALAPAPDDRFQTAREFALAFADAIGEPPPPSVSVPNLTLYARASLLPPRPAAGSMPSISVTRPSPVEPPRRSGEAPTPSRPKPPAVDPRERDTSPEPFASTRASGPEGTLTSAPRSLPPRPRRRSPRVPVGYALAAFAVVVAGLTGMFIGRAASPGAVIVLPAAAPPPAPSTPAAAPSATVVPVLSKVPPRAPAPPPRPRALPRYTPSGI